MMVLHDDGRGPPVVLWQAEGKASGRDHSGEPFSHVCNGILFPLELLLDRRVCAPPKRWRRDIRAGERVLPRHALSCFLSATQKIKK